MKKLTPLLFIVMCAAQWYVPGSMIAQQENVLRTGKVFKFKTAPVDPADPFRGSYITLRFESNTVPNTTGELPEMNTRAYGLLKVNSAGYAEVTSIVLTPPDDPNTDYCEVVLSYPDSSYLRFDFPFDRFYLEESKAPETERQYWKHVSDTTSNVYAVVRIKQGTASLEDVVMNGRSVVEIVEDMNEQ